MPRWVRIAVVGSCAALMVAYICGDIAPIISLPLLLATQLTMLAVVGWLFYAILAPFRRGCDRRRKRQEGTIRMTNGEEVDHVSSPVGKSAVARDQLAATLAGTVQAIVYDPSDRRRPEPQRFHDYVALWRRGQLLLDRDGASSRNAEVR